MVVIVHKGVDNVAKNIGAECSDPKIVGSAENAR
jgi:hypothetical protein